MSNVIIESLFKNATVFLNDAIFHFNRYVDYKKREALELTFWERTINHDKLYAEQALSIVNIQMALELAVKYQIALWFGISYIFENKSVNNLSEEAIIDNFSNNKLKIKDFEQLKNFLKSNEFFSKEFSQDFIYMEKFQNYRNKLVHQNYNFSVEEANAIEDEIIYIIVYILYRLLSSDISSSDCKDFIYEYIPEEEYKKLLSNETFAKKIKEKFESEYGKLYMCPHCFSKSMTPLKKCYRCLNRFDDGHFYGYVKCNYCGEDFVCFDAANIDINKGFTKGLCLNCEEDTTVYKCQKCGDYNDLEAFGRKMCTPDHCLWED